jgi:hypothetical protein
MTATQMDSQMDILPAVCTHFYTEGTQIFIVRRIFSGHEIGNHLLSEPLRSYKRQITFELNALNDYGAQVTTMCVLLYADSMPATLARLTLSPSRRTSPHTVGEASIPRIGNWHRRNVHESGRAQRRKISSVRRGDVADRGCLSQFAWDRGIRRSSCGFWV